MFGLIEMVAPPDRFADRLLSRFRKPDIFARRLMGASALLVQIPVFPGERRAGLRRRAVRAAKAMAYLGVRAAVFPKDFSFCEEFARWEIRPFPVLPLYRKMAAEVVFRIMQERGMDARNVTVAVSGERVSYFMREAAVKISQKARYMSLAAGPGGEALCSMLRRDYGVPIVFGPTEKQREAADIRLLFSQTKAGDKGIDVALYEDAPIRGNAPTATGASFRLCREMDETLPQDCNRTQLLAALMESGAILPGDIEVESIIWSSAGQGT